MIARPNMSRNEWKMTEIGTSTKLGISHPCPAQAVLVLHSSGFDVSALYGGFGLWGVVIGYASRNILEDLFAGLSRAPETPP